VLDDESKPDLGDVPMGPAMLTRKLEQRSDGVVVARYRFVLPKPLWTADEVNAFRKAYDAYGASAVPVLSFEHQGEKLHKAREFDKELDAYRRDVRAHPDAAAPKMRLAQALHDLGFGTSARKLADEATRIAPNDIELWNYAGYIRTSDTLGRWHKPGWDRDGAIAAFRQSLQLDPTSLYAATQLAALYEYNPGGHRYQTGSNLDDAVKVLDGLDADKLADYEKGDWVYNAIFDLTYLRRFDEVRARIGKMDAKKVPMVPAIVSAGMVGGGATAALSEAQKVAPTGPQRTTVLQGAADIFIALRHYPEATALLSAAIAGSSDANLRHRVDVIGKTKPIDPPKMPVVKPEDVVRKLLAICTVRAPTMKDDLKPLVSRRETDPEGVSLFASFCDGMGIAPSNAQDVPRDALADIVAASMDFHVDGSDALGYRVGVTMGEQKFSFFVVREGSSLQLRTTSFSPPDMGCEALAMQRAGRKAAAVKWLTWARELVTPSGGDDPLRDSPFLQTWTEDKGVDVELAAATLCAGRGRSDLTASTLNAARAKASGDRLTAIDHAIALSYTGNGHAADLLGAATQLRKDAPSSETAWLLERSALAELGKFQQLRDESAAWLAKAPTDPQRLWDLADAEDRMGHFKEARAVGERCIATGKGGTWAYNQQAWRALYVGVTDKDLEYALKAVNAEPNEPAYLNTLAAIDIALGHTADARERFVKALELRKGEAPDDGDWYVLGRIAEQLGLPDEARAAYAKVSPGDKSLGQRTIARLAQARVAGLR
jgi:tetratricopeptide (TPR) repeat protein